MLLASSSTNAFYFHNFFNFKSPSKPTPEPMTKDIETALRTGKFVKVYVPVYKIHYASVPPVDGGGINQPPLVFIPENSVNPQIIPKRDDYPQELLDLAKKLGFTDIELSQMPTFEEIQGLAGTSTKEETIAFIKDFMSTEEGRDMARAFLFSGDDSRRRRRRSIQLLRLNQNRFQQYREVAEKDVALAGQILTSQIPTYRRNFFSLF